MSFAVVVPEFVSWTLAPVPSLVNEMTPLALMFAGAVALSAPPLVVVAQLGQTMLPVEAEIVSGNDAVTAGVPLLDPALHVGVPATSGVVIVSAPLVPALMDRVPLAPEVPLIATAPLAATENNFELSALF